MSHTLTFNFCVSSIRVVMLDGNPWFVAADVCSALEIINVARAMSRLDDDEKGVHTVNTLGGNQQMTVVSESGLYSLTLTSRKPEAKKFKKWVTSEVLPSIRKTGGYSSTPAAMPRYVIPQRDSQHINARIRLFAAPWRYSGSVRAALRDALRDVSGATSVTMTPVESLTAVHSEIERLAERSETALQWLADAEEQALAWVFGKIDVLPAARFHR
jgi:prophage antirepressor-like protein